jgi:hypothetical protein
MWVVGVIVTLWSALLTSTGVEAARMPAFVHAGVGTADIGRHVADSVVFTPTAISSVSCTSAGNCSAGGSADSSGAVAAPLVVDQEHGIWDRARGLPRGGALVADRADTTSVSCVSAGECAAGGYYGSGDTYYAFVASQNNGIWGRALQVPGLARLNTGGWAEINSVSCGSADNCSAGGEYTSGSSQQAFVVSENNGIWGRALQVPGLARLNKGGFARIWSVSCASAGNCSGGGDYADVSGHQQAFVVSEANGIWRRALQVPGLAHLDTRGFAQILSVSCASAGDCSGGGDYTDGSGQQAFVVSEKDGRWDAQRIPGLARLNAGGVARISSVSCASAGNCSAGGYYTNQSGEQRALAVSEKDGRWGPKQPISGLARLHTDGIAQILSVSCASAGNCSAAGSSRYWKVAQPFVVSENNGRWGQAERIPGLHGWVAAISSVSCASAGNCSAGGAYGRYFYSRGYAFVVSQKHGTWGAAQKLPAQRS